MPFELAENSLHCRNILGKFLYVKTFFSCCSCRHQTVHDVHADWSKTRWAILDSPQTIENVLVLNFYTINTPLYHNVLILTTVMRRLHRNHLPTKQNDVVSSSPQANMLLPPNHLHSSFRAIITHFMCMFLLREVMQVISLRKFHPWLWYSPLRPSHLVATHKYVNWNYCLFGSMFVRLVKGIEAICVVAKAINMMN